MGGRASRSPTPAQLRILRLMALGYDTKQIAVKLEISPNTVRTHRQNLLLKLGARNAAHMMAIAFRRGLVQ